MSVTVLIPLYCEAGNIEKLVREIEELKLNVLVTVIDDSSPDGTCMHSCRTKYVPPRYDTLYTNGLSRSTEELDEEVRHPLTFFRRKLNAGSSKSWIKRT